MIGLGSSSGLRVRGTNHHHKLTSTTQRQRRRPRISTVCSYSGMPDFTAHYAVLGLTPFASKSDVKQAYKALALKYHPDVYKGEDGSAKPFTQIKSAYECLMQKFDEDELQTGGDFDEYDDWEEWMGFEGGVPVIYKYNPF